MIESEKPPSRRDSRSLSIAASKNEPLEIPLNSSVQMPRAQPARSDRVRRSQPKQDDLKPRARDRERQPNTLARRDDPIQRNSRPPSKHHVPPRPDEWHHGNAPPSQYPYDQQPPYRSPPMFADMQRGYDAGRRFYSHDRYHEGPVDRYRNDWHHRPSRMHSRSPPRYRDPNCDFRSGSPRRNYPPAATATLPQAPPFDQLPSGTSDNDCLIDGLGSSEQLTPETHTSLTGLRQREHVDDLMESHRFKHSRHSMYFLSNQCCLTGEDNKDPVSTLERVPKKRRTRSADQKTDSASIAVTPRDLTYQRDVRKRSGSPVTFPANRHEQYTVGRSQSDHRAPPPRDKHVKRVFTERKQPVSDQSHVPNSQLLQQPQARKDRILSSAVVDSPEGAAEVLMESTGASGEEVSRKRLQQPKGDNDDNTYLYDNKAASDKHVLSQKEVVASAADANQAKIVSQTQATLLQSTVPERPSQPAARQKAQQNDKPDGQGDEQSIEQVSLAEKTPRIVRLSAPRLAPTESPAESRSTTVGVAPRASRIVRLSSTTKSSAVPVVPTVSDMGMKKIIRLSAPSPSKSAIPVHNTASISTPVQGAKSTSTRAVSHTVTTSTASVTVVLPISPSPRRSSVPNVFEDVSALLSAVRARTAQESRSTTRVKLKRADAISQSTTSEPVTLHPPEPTSSPPPAVSQSEPTVQGHVYVEEMQEAIRTDEPTENPVPASPSIEAVNDASQEPLQLPPSSVNNSESAVLDMMPALGGWEDELSGDISRGSPNINTQVQTVQQSSYEATGITDMPSSPNDWREFRAAIKRLVVKRMSKYYDSGRVAKAEFSKYCDKVIRAIMRKETDYLLNTVERKAEKYVDGFIKHKGL